MALITRIILYLFGYLAARLFQDRGDGFFQIFRELWQRSDAPHYLDIAEDWYANAGEDRVFLVFLPLYPLLVRVVAAFFGGDALFAGIALSLVAFSAASAVVYKAACEMRMGAAWDSLAADDSAAVGSNGYSSTAGSAAGGSSAHGSAFADSSNGDGSVAGNAVADALNGYSSASNGSVVGSVVSDGSNSYGSTADGAVADSAAGVSLAHGSAVADGAAGEGMAAVRTSDCSTAGEGMAADAQNAGAVAADGAAADGGGAFRAAKYLICFPASFFVNGTFTEGLFLLASALCFYYMLKRRWVASGLMGLLAALTRYYGILLAIPLAVELLQDAAARRRRSAAREGAKAGGQAGERGGGGWQSAGTGGQADSGGGSWQDVGSGGRSGGHGDGGWQGRGLSRQTGRGDANWQGEDLGGRSGGHGDGDWQYVGLGRQAGGHGDGDWQYVGLGRQAGERSDGNWQDGEGKGRERIGFWPRAAAVLLPLLGTGLYLLLNYAVSGNAFQFLIYQREHWNQSFGLFFINIGNLAANALQWSPRESAALFVPQLAMVMLNIALIIYGIVKKFRLSMLAYLAAYFLISISASWMLSFPRYMFGAVPIYWLLAQAGRRRAADALITFSLVFGLAYYMLAYVSGYHVY
ncbi:MAG: hypothetical protein LBJ10_00880 [Clostridiales bacterium]|nr:hypothetical protein [Clostridiales bacterium]